MNAVALRALNDQRLHRIALAAYWRAVDAELALKVAAAEAEERVALSAAKAALADAEAEHGALLARLAYLDSAEMPAASFAPTALATLGVSAAASGGDVREGASASAEAACAGKQGAAAPAIPVAHMRAAAPTPTAVTDGDKIMVRTGASAARPATPTVQAAATRRSVAMAVVAERLAPVRAERAATETALAAMREANAALRARLATAAETGTAAAPTRSAAAHGALPRARRL